MTISSVLNQYPDPDSDSDPCSESAPGSESDHAFDGDSDDARLAVHGEIVLLRITDLVDADSPRSAGVDHDHIRTIAAVEEQLPPILVHAQTMRVIDGMHRLAAARGKGQTEIRARLFYGGVHDAFRLGVRANVVHGLPLTTADRHAAATRILRAQPSLSDRSIAGATGLATRTVAGLRRQVTNGADGRIRVGRDGRVRPLNATEGRLTASRIIAAQPEASLREIARAAGISVGTARDVRLKLMAGEDPAPVQRDGVAAAPATSDGPPHSAAEVDIGKAMDSLRRDPSVRYSDSGRALVRWLEARIVTMGQWRGASDHIPVHSRGSVERIARECARAWTQFADEIRQSDT